MRDDILSVRLQVIDEDEANYVFEAVLPCLANYFRYQLHSDSVLLDGNTQKLLDRMLGALLDLHKYLQVDVLKEVVMFTMRLIFEAVDKLDSSLVFALSRVSGRT